MDWEPISKSEIGEFIDASYTRMELQQRDFWNSIKIEPQKWQLHPWGDLGNGFWVVAIQANNVIWYNDIEMGFNSSTFSQYGKINEYWCNQDELEWQINTFMVQLAIQKTPVNPTSIQHTTLGQMYIP